MLSACCLFRLTQADTALYFDQEQRTRVILYIPLKTAESAPLSRILKKCTSGQLELGVIST
jgi:hypothetical protein